MTYSVAFPYFGGVSAPVLTNKPIFSYPLDVHNGTINKLKLIIMLISFFMGLLKALAVTTVAYTGKELLNAAEKSEKEDKK